MSRPKSARRRLLLWLLPLAVLLLAAFAAFLLLRPRRAPGPALEAILSSARKAQVAALGNNSLLSAPAAQCFSLETEGEAVARFRDAEASVRVTRLNVDSLTADMAPEMQPLVAEMVGASRLRSDVYAADGSFLPSVTVDAYEKVLNGRLEHLRDYCESFTLPVSLSWSSSGWQLTDPSVLDGLLPPLPASPGYAAAVAALEPVEFHYALSDRTSAGPVPDASRFGWLEDPAELLPLLETADAVRLIGGQRLDFSPKNVLPGRGVHYYLDETILAIVWQQDEHGAVGTFAEVFLADASQFRRKLAGDAFGSDERYYPSELAAQANAVVAMSGDFYNSGRSTYGLCVYDGQLLRSCLYAGDTCLITDEGDMLFVYEGAFSTQEEAQRFLDENRVSFSLAFGPVMIDHGEDVTPYSYPIGEVLDTYARCAIGQLGPLHYLGMTINCESPDHYVYVTLRQAADSMLAHNCWNAYTLDGGQTGSILIGGKLINPVQFGVERTMSDIIYFATAIPEA